MADTESPTEPIYESDCCWVCDHGPCICEELEDERASDKAVRGPKEPKT